MSRVIRVDGPGKTRNQVMRTAAEVIRHLSQKANLDKEARDMASLLVFCFRRIDEGIDESVRAWEKRAYWVKAEQFRVRWGWAGPAADRLEALIRADEWDRLPALLAELLTHFSDITIARFTREAAIWQGAYDRLLAEGSRSDGGRG